MPVRRAHRNRLPGVAGAVLVAACLAPGAAPAALDLEPCHLDGLSEQIRCGSFAVPEDRARPDGRRLELAVSVVPARSARPEPDPLVLLAGGPGQAARDLAVTAGTVFAGVRGRRDLVLVDLRGTGDSAPLDCPEALESPSSSDPAALARAAERCAGHHSGRDLRQYGHDAALDDLAEVLTALGYPRVNLWGGSFGTRAALHFAVRFPERVRSLVLDAPAPPELRFPLFAARDAQRVLDRLHARCAADAACSAAYPDAPARLTKLLARLGGAPARATLPDPRTGEPISRVVSRDDFAAALRGALYVPRHAALVPLLVDRAAGGDFGPYAALTAETAAWSIDTMSLGVTLAVVCSEDLPRIPEDDVGAATDGTFVGRAFIDAWRALCSGWPTAPAPAELAAAIPIPAPALVLTGELDPITPPVWAEATAERLPRSRVVVVPGGGHTVSGSGCVPRLIASFLEATDPDALDPSCLSTWSPPAPVLDAAGSTR